MRVVAMVSGGKDSCYNMMQCVAEGHQIVALANLHPKDKDELDSYMYQTVGHMGIEKLSEAMELPLYRMETKGISKQTGKQYVPTDDDEVEDLYNLLKWTKQDLNVDAVAVGAILSDYQRVRVENVCNRLNLVSLAYLWRRDQTELLQEMIDCQVFAIIIKVASLGLVPDRHLGKSLRDIQPHLLQMKDKYGLNACGEGGEYETFTLNCPLFKQQIVVDDMQTVISSLDPIAPVGYINFTKLRLVPKEKPEEVTVKTSIDYLSDLNVTPYDDLSDTEQNDQPDVEHNSNIEEMSTSNSLENIKLNNENLTNLNNQATCVISNSGWIWISGIQGNGSSAREGMLDALNVFSKILSTSSFDLSNICHVTLYVRNMSDFATINEAYVSIFNISNPPTRVCVECPLPLKCKVIMEAIGYRGRDLDLENCKHTMHVQGISHWAPANIGPYSQSTKIGDITFISGQIALVPGSMKIIDGGIRFQCKLALRHITRIAQAMNSKGQLRDVVQAICFVTDPNFIVEARRQWEKRTTNAIVNYIVVSALPRQALVEWQVWLHAHNDKFDYEETGYTVGDFTVFSIRRWNNDSNCAAIVCSASTSRKCSDLNEENILTTDFTKMANFSGNDIKQILKYTINKLLKGRLQTSNKDNTELVDNNSAQNIIPSIHLKCFYQINRIQSIDLLTQSICEFREEYKNVIQIGCTVIPVCRLHNSRSFLSVCGIRQE